MLLTTQQVNTLSGRELKAALRLARKGQVTLPAAFTKALWRLPSWTPQPKQELFLDCVAGEVLFGGAAGGGKTDGLLNWAIRFCQRYPGAQGILARRDMTSMYGTRAIIPRSEELFTGTGWVFRSAPRPVWCAPDGSRIYFKQIGKNFKEAEINLQGSAPEFLGIEEAGQVRGDLIDYAIGRCRSTRPGVVTEVRLTANPGGPGHSYLKKRYVSPARPNEVWQPPIPKEGTIEPRTRCFIPSLIEDNQVLIENDPQYLAALENLPEPYRSAYRFGLWDLFVGQFFGSWNESVHVEDPFPIPEHWPRIASLDWGYGHPSVFLWGAVDEAGVVHVYRELWVRLHTVSELVERFFEYPDSARVSQVGAGPDIFTLQRSFRGGPTIATEFEEHGLLMSNPCAGRPRRHQWQQVRHYMRYSDQEGGRLLGLPLLRVSSECDRLLDQIPEMQYSTTDPEDMEKVDIHPETGEGGDDCVDALGYLLMMRPFAARPEQAEKAGSMSVYKVGLERQRARRARAAGSLTR